MKKIIISKEPWQTRAAILHNDKLQDLYFETQSDGDLERCFFKGKVSKVLPGIQTAFVDIGKPKAGFLHITEVDRALALDKELENQGDEDTRDIETIQRQIKHSMDIGRIFTEGEELLVQVIKEPVYEKGAKLTTCFTLPGKFVVLMPNIPQVGISKKIEAREERQRLREIVQKSLPKGMGAIVRTTAEERPDKDIQKDLSFLVNTWNAIEKKFKKSKPGDRVHEDLPIPIRAVREHLDDDIEMVVCDDKEDLSSVYKFVKHFMPEQAHKIKLYQEKVSLFDHYEIDKQIEEALNKKVHLRSGSTLVIESTEAMTVVDVNTGKFTGKDNMEDTILRTNLEAAEEIVRQLRLRNIGGLIVIDFIDMNNGHNRQKLSRFLEKQLRERDKFQSVALKVSEFGLVQMTRKRSGKTLVHQLSQECQSCHGLGFIPSPATVSFSVLRSFAESIKNRGLSGSLVLSVAHKVFDYLVHNEYQALLSLEKLMNCKIVLESNEKFEDSYFTVEPQKAIPG